MPRDPTHFNPVLVKVYATAYETEDGLLVVTRDFEKVWLPKSQICEHSGVKHLGDSGDLIVPKWLAVEKGLPFLVPGDGSAIDLE